MKVLNILSTGGVGGIEQLCKNIGKYADYYNTFCFMFGEGTIYEEMKRNGMNVISLSNIGRSKMNIHRWKRICEIAKDYDIIVTHHCTIALQLYYYFLKKTYRKKKYVMTIHSCFDEEQNFHYSTKIKNKFAGTMIKKALNLSDVIIFVSNAGRKSYMDNYHIDYKKTKIVYNGIELQNTDDLIEERKVINNLERDYYQVTYIGRLERIKGIHLLIEAISMLPSDLLEKTKVWIIGDGNYKNILEENTNRLKLNEKVKFLGTKRNIGDYLINSDIFVYPSICQEVFGISIVEAMSFGVPCIANRVGGIPEIIENGINGLITETSTAKAICDGLVWLINSYKNNNISIMRDNCRKTAEKFTIQDTVKELKNIYEGLI